MSPVIRLPSVPPYTKTAFHKKTVKRLKAAGAVILGKTNMNEFATGGKGGFNPQHGDTRNPWSLDHEPSGSSSGTGASVAAHLCLGGTGTDAGGSVRGALMMDSGRKTTNFDSL